MELEENLSALGYTGFQGYFLQRPETFTGKRAPTFRVPAMQVIAALQQGDYTAEQIERLVSQDLGLVHRLLRCLNSGFYNLPRQVTSIRHAIVILGREQLMRLCAAVALAEFKDRPDWLLVNALVRARMCELLAPPRAARESGGFFFAGLLSHLDALLGLPTQQAISGLPLTPTVEQALVEQSGPIGATLRGVQAWEQGRFEGLGDGLDERTLRYAYLEAVEWAEQVRPMLKL